MLNIHIKWLAQAANCGPPAREISQWEIGMAHIHRFSVNIMTFRIAELYIIWRNLQGYKFILHPHIPLLLFGISLWKLCHFYFSDYRDDIYITGSLKASLFTPTGWTAWRVTGWAIG